MTAASVMAPSEPAEPAGTAGTAGPAGPVGTDAEVVILMTLLVMRVVVLSREGTKTITVACCERLHTARYAPPYG
ncbi:hypothetical protein GCM10023336_68260 [Streptomyces similanensis]|uniref:Uncharacterized protein n=1 Tax=Streptomyces similanensis TaxID=1274988 RepID=A0ABP9LFI4_9ACTN